jgi:hypothetical protein
MKVKISAMEITSEKDKENSLPKQPIENLLNFYFVSSSNQVYFIFHG